MKKLFKFKERNMTKRNHYNTRQKTAILKYLEGMPGEHVTVNDIHEHLASEGIGVGVTTIYRRLAELTEEGLVAKYQIDGASGACFEYIGKDHCHEELCIHCKCEQCGELIHLHCDEFKLIGAHLLSDHGFKVDSKRTVIYGLCDDCMGRRIR